MNKAKNNFESYARKQIEINRRRNPTEMPVWLKDNYNAYIEMLLAAAGKSFKDTGIWFLTRGDSRDKDEQETMAVWGTLLRFFDLEELPYYSEKNQQQAVTFWQSWQNLKTGRLYNPLYQDPQNPEIKRNTPGNRGDYSPDKINLKYVPNILACLNAKLPMPCETEFCASYSEKPEDTFDQIWEAIEKWNSSHAGAFPFFAAQKIDDGEWDKIPQIEAGMGAIIRGYNKETGMWRPEPLEGFPWADYLPSSGFKVISRLCGYLGLENFPEDMLKTSIDNLLMHKEELLHGNHPAMPRNYAEMMAHRLLLTDYRHEELLNAMEYCLNGFRDRELWLKTETSGYSIFGSALIGIFMNWTNMPSDKLFNQWFRFEQGCLMKYRFVAGPYGNWVNVIPKEPKAVYTHPDFEMDKYDVKARNKIHWAKKITELLPSKNVALKLSEDSMKGHGTFTFTLTSGQFTKRNSLYLKAMWTGAYDISFSGKPIKRVRYNLPEVPAGWHIPLEVAENLRLGENTIEINLMGPGKDQSMGAPQSKNKPFICLGLIDWN